MKNLFENEQKKSKTAEIEVSAKRLAILFSEDKDIPIQYRKGKTKTKKIKEDSLIQIRFDKSVESWKKTIGKILQTISLEQSWRFINLNPKEYKGIKSVTENKDFLEFTDYLVLRRDKKSCGDKELGCLANLHTAFQRKIEAYISTHSPDFVAIDFEYATRDLSSVCSVGIVTFKDGNVVDKYSSLIKPPNNEYEFIKGKPNVHNLSPDKTKSSPDFREVYPEIKKRIENNTLVAHNAFSTDKHCLEKAMVINNISDDLNLNWKCTKQICDSGLKIASKVCNIPLDHHDALSDASACGHIYQLFINGTLPLSDIQNEKQLEKDKKKKNIYPEALKGDILKPDFENAKNKDTPFFMKKVVVTGFSNSQKKKIAIELKALGADIDGSVGKRTNFLIIGETPGPSKLKLMELNIKDGKEAKILTLEEYEKIK